MGPLVSAASARGSVATKRVRLLLRLNHRKRQIRARFVFAASSISTRVRVACRNHSEELRRIIPVNIPIDGPIIELTRSPHDKMIERAAIIDGSRDVVSVISPPIDDNKTISQWRRGGLVARSS
jgi:hypothetical protein